MFSLPQYNTWIEMNWFVNQEKVLNDDAMASKYLSVRINKLKELVSRNPIKRYKDLLESSFDTLNDWNLTYDENQKEL